jgi:putative restriction endonuclease
MNKLTFTAAFACYGAKLINTRWAFSAIANDGSFIISGWQHFLKSSVDGQKRYEDRLSRMLSNHMGKKLLANHLRIAIEGDLPVRLVIATLDDPKESLAGDASLLRKTFSIDENLVGKVIEFDGDKFAIEFRS